MLPSSGWRANRSRSQNPGNITTYDETRPSRGLGVNFWNIHKKRRKSSASVTTFENLSQQRRNRRNVWTFRNWTKWCLTMQTWGIRGKGMVVMMTSQVSCMKALEALSLSHQYLIFFFFLKGKYCRYFDGQMIHWFISVKELVSCFVVAQKAHWPHRLKMVR